MKSFKKCSVNNDLDDAKDDFIYESNRQTSSHTESYIYDEEASKRDLLTSFGDSDKDFELEGFVKFLNLLCNYFCLFRLSLKM